MKKLSKNKKLNYVLNDIYVDLMNVGIDEIKRYKEEYKNEIDYNLYQYGNMRIYYYELEDLYKDYKSLKNRSVQYLESIYKRQIRYITNLILRENY